MKRITKTFVIILLVMMMSPLTAFATPGFLEVDLTPKNFNQYFEIVKMKHYDDSGKYDSYVFILKSKLLAKGYYLYSAKDFYIKYTGTARCKQTHNKITYKSTDKLDSSLSYYFNYIAMFHKDNDYKYGKITKFNVKKAKGKLIFIEPSNVIGIKDVYQSDGSYKGKAIILKQPYDKLTEYVYHEDDDENEIIEYYYKPISGSNTYTGGKKEIIVR